jgi:hypothetical protein
MTALPHTMPDAEILREHEASEARIVAEWHAAPVQFTPPPCDVCTLPGTMYVRSDAARCRAVRCDEHGAETITELHRRGYDVAVERYGVVNACSECGNAFELDERRHYVRLNGSRRKAFVCTSCLARGEYRDVFTSSTAREEARAGKPYGVLRAENLLTDAGEDFPVYERVECSACGESVAVDDFDAKAKTCRECDRKRAIESGDAMADWKWGRDS